MAGRFRQQIDDEILDRAAGLFAQHGFAQTSLKSLADAVGLSKPGLLHHFPSKEALYEAALGLGQALGERVLEQLEPLPSGPDRDRRALELLTDIALDRPGLVALGFRSLTAPDIDPANNTYDTFVEKIFAVDLAAAPPDRVVRVMGALSALAALMMCGRQRGGRQDHLAAAHHRDLFRRDRPSPARRRCIPFFPGGGLIPMAVLLHRLGMAAYRGRLAVVLLWLVVLIGSGVGALTLSGTTSNSFAIPGQESSTALEKIKAEFGAGGASARVVVQAPQGQTLTTPENAQAIGKLVAELGTLPGVTSASNPLDPAAPTINAAQDTAFSTVTFDAAAGEVTAEQQTALLDTVDDARTGGLTAEVTGEATQTPPHIGGVTEALGVVIALLILALTYGSLVTAGMNLLTASVGVGIGVLGITIATGFMELQSTTTALAGMLGLAVGIDYALFIINRYRQELRGGADVPTAIGIAVGTAGSAVVTAGITVIIALVGLVVVGIPFLTQMGLAAAGTIVVAVLIAITLVPAVLGYLGRRALPRKQRTAPATAAPADTADAPERGFYAGWIGTITRRRVTALLLSIIALGVVAVPFAAMRTTLVQLPEADSTQARAEQLLTDGFGPGFNGPLVVLFEGDNATRTATDATGAISALGDVAVVTRAIPNADDTAAMLTVIAKSGPTSEATERLVTELREQLSGLSPAPPP
jgi:RND superfamily putative drug exporter